MCPPRRSAGSLLAFRSSKTSRRRKACNPGRARSAAGAICCRIHWPRGRAPCYLRRFRRAPVRFVTESRSLAASAGRESARNGRPPTQEWRVVPNIEFYMISYNQVMVCPKCSLHGMRNCFADTALKDCLKKENALCHNPSCENLFCTNHGDKMRVATIHNTNMLRFPEH